MAKIKIKTIGGFSEIATVNYVDTQIVSAMGTANSVANSLTLTKNNTDIEYNGSLVQKVTIPTIHYGTEVPSDDFGQDGDLFVIIELSTISFSIGGVPYLAYENTTWAEWVESEFNTLGAYVHHFATTDKVEYIETEKAQGRYICEYRTPSDKFVSGDDIIISGHDYDISYKFPLEPGAY